MNTDIQLSDGLIFLRQPKASDVLGLYLAVVESLSDLSPWLDWATDAYDEASTYRWLNNVQIAWTHSSAFHFVITDARSGETIGCCSLDGIDKEKHSCNLGYWVRSSRTRQGIASRAVRLAAQFAFDTLKMLQVEILIAAENIASQRIAQKIGAHHKGLLTDGLVVHTTVYDAVKFVLIPADMGLSG